MQTSALYASFTKVALVSLAETYIIRNLSPTVLPHPVTKQIVILSILLNFFVFLVYGIFIYPHFRDPLRHLPTVKNIRLRETNFVAERLRGATPLRWANAHAGADLIRVRGFIKSTVIVRSPHALRDVLHAQSYDFEKPKSIRLFLARVLGFGLIASEGNTHKKHRKTITPAFNLRAIRELYHLLWHKKNILLEQIESDIRDHPAPRYEHEANAVIGFAEIFEWSRRFTLDIIGPTTLGKDLCSLTRKEDVFIRAFLDLLGPTKGRLVLFVLYLFAPEVILRRMPTKINEVLDKNMIIVRTVCGDVVNEKRSALCNHRKLTTDSTSHDILSQIISAGNLTNYEIVDQMLTFLAAGQDTTASALTWTIYTLARSPHAQMTLRHEVRNAIPSASHPITHATLEDLPYLNGVISETLRLYPSIPATMRQSICDTIIAGTSIPAHTLIFICPYAINRAVEGWGPNANDFVPERWIDTTADGVQRPNKHGGAPSNFNDLTFLHGPRACIGKDFAKAELRAAVAAIVGRFAFELQYPAEEVVPAAVITMKPAGGLKLRMKVVEGW